MIGFVSPQLRALLRVEVFGRQTQIEVEAVVDTGFSAFLSLPSQTIRDLGLDFQQTLFATLADGNDVELQTYSATARWNDELLPIYVIQSESQPLLGMSFLENHQLTIEVRDGGTVRLETL